MRKASWSTEQWREFARKCAAACEAVDELIEGFPATPGLTAAHIDGLIKVHDALFAAMIEAENCYAQQYPERDGEGVSVIFGSDRRNNWGEYRGEVPSDAPKLTREEWIEWGRKFKHARGLIMALFHEFQTARFATSARQRAFIRAYKTFFAANLSLHALCSIQHPGWVESITVFYGQGETS